jgi:AcrR family transcriptional regulator
MRMIASAKRKRPNRAEKNALTTAALLEAAAQTFAERGYEAATMDEIAERIGLSKGALYYRYRTKEDLFLALLDQRCAAYLAELERPLEADVDPRAGWSAFANQFLEVIREGSWPRLFFEFVSYSSRSPRAHRELATRIRRLRKAIERRVQEQADRAGTELPITAADVALAISALGNGLALERLADRRSVPDRAFTELPGLIIGGIAVRAQSSPAAARAGVNHDRGHGPDSHGENGQKRRSR